MAVDAQDWENLGYFAGPEGMMFIEFKNKELRKYMGKTLAEVAASYSAISQILPSLTQRR
jgi:N-acyl-D-amino-acid deacylase